jgi:hypothetical protein
MLEAGQEGKMTQDEIIAALDPLPSKAKAYVINKVRDVPTTVELIRLMMWDLPRPEVLGVYNFIGEFFPYVKESTK